MEDLKKLEQIIAHRANEDGDVSYTAKLLERGIDYASKKLGEEAVETVIAAINEDDDALIGEASDLLYHLLVVLKARNISLDQIYQELDKRTAQSGLQEKASRKK